MPRPYKPRLVSAMPRFTLFKPTGIPISLLDEIVLTVDELEALRLKDIEKLEQNECAARMKVAQSTLQRILVSAHEKVARAIVEGKVLRIHGGPYALQGEQLCGRCRRHRMGFKVPGPTGDDCPDCSNE